MAKDHLGNMEQNNNDEDKEIIRLKKENAYLTDTIMNLKQENASLNDTINILQKEKLVQETQYNRLQTIINNINSTIRTIPSRLLELSDSTTSVLQLVKIASNLHMMENTLSSSSIMQEKISENKAHVVKPHMVNGHILHIPTINLTRIPDLHYLQRNNETIQNPERHESNSTSPNVNNDNNDNSENRGSFENVTQPASNSERATLFSIPEITESSQQSSESSSTVLSGTFQEVNIYQISDQFFNGRNEAGPSFTRVHVDENFIRSDVYKKAFLPTVNLTRLKRKTSPTKGNSNNKKNKNNEEVKELKYAKKRVSNKAKEGLKVTEGPATTSNVCEGLSLRRSSRIRKRLFN